MKVTTALLALSSFAHLGLCDLGDVTTYRPPYLPTKCHGYDQSQIPPGNLFGAVGPGLWNSGAACGRVYKVRCINSKGGTGSCINADVYIVIIEGRLGNKAPALSLSMTAGQKIYTGSGTFKAEYYETLQ